MIHELKIIKNEFSIGELVLIDKSNRAIQMNIGIVQEIHVERMGDDYLLNID